MKPGHISVVRLRAYQKKVLKPMDWPKGTYDETEMTLFFGYFSLWEFPHFPQFFLSHSINFVTPAALTFTQNIELQV